MTVYRPGRSPQTRRSLLNLAVQWRELRVKMDNVNVGSLANGPGGMYSEGP
jgi:hypothetical protein